MNTPFPCYNCYHLYVDCMQKDNPAYIAECKFSLPMGNSKCPEFTKWIDAVGQDLKDDVNKRLCELLGICWHEQIDDQTLQCKHCGAPMLFPWHQNPDFASSAGRIDLLRRMRTRDDHEEFTSFINPNYSWDTYLIDLLLDDNGALAKVALEFLEGKHEE